MPKIWRNRIIARDKQYENCPTAYKIAVKELLRQDVVDGVITEEDYAIFISNDDAY